MIGVQSIAIIEETEIGLKGQFLMLHLRQNVEAMYFMFFSKICMMMQTASFRCKMYSAVQCLIIINLLMVLIDCTWKFW